MPTASPKPTNQTASTVIKRMCSFPKGLFKHAEAEAKRIAREEGRGKPNFSAYLCRLIFVDKSQTKKTSEPEIK